MWERRVWKVKLIKGRVLLSTPSEQNRDGGGSYNVSQYEEEEGRWSHRISVVNTEQQITYNRFWKKMSHDLRLTLLYPILCKALPHYSIDSNVPTVQNSLPGKNLWWSLLWNSSKGTFVEILQNFQKNIFETIFKLIFVMHIIKYDRRRRFDENHNEITFLNLRDEKLC